jgi:hypothetical protein
MLMWSCGEIYLLGRTGATARKAKAELLTQAGMKHGLQDSGQSRESGIKSESRQNWALRKDASRLG